MYSLNLKRITELVDVQARMNMRAQSNKLILSYLWWILEPILLVSMFYVVFDYVLDRGGNDYFLFLIVGQATYMWISKGIIMGANSLRQNKGIIGQRPIPKWIFPLVSVQEASYKGGITFIIMLIVLILTGKSNPIYWWQLIPVILTMYALTSGISFLLSILVAIAEDFNQIIGLFMMGLMFGSGVFWDINTIANPSIKAMILIFNPVANLIDINRSILLENKIIDFSLLISPILISISFWIIGLYLFKKINNRITRMLFS